MGRVLQLVFVLGLQGLLTSAASSQTTKVPLVGFLASGSAAHSRSEQVAKRLNELGYRDGENVVFQFKDANGRSDRLRELAEDLVRAKPDVIVAVTNASAFAVKKATTSIPIVVYAAHDAVGTGLVASLARPGGNITGVDSLAPILDAKRLEILRQLVPALTGVNVLFNPDDPGSSIHLRLTDEAARTMNVAVLKRVEVLTAADFERALSSIAPNPKEGLLTLTDPVTANWKPAAQFALSRGADRLRVSISRRARVPLFLWSHALGDPGNRRQAGGPDLGRHQTRGHPIRTTQQVRAGHQPGNSQTAGLGHSKAADRRSGRRAELSTIRYRPGPTRFLTRRETGAKEPGSSGRLS